MAKKAAALFPVDERGCLFYWCVKRGLRPNPENIPYVYHFGHIKYNCHNTPFGRTLQWIANTPFDDAMQIIETYEEKTIVRSEKTGFYYAIYPSDLCRILLSVDIERGQIEGTWQYIHRGNYGITLCGNNE